MKPPRVLIQIQKRLAPLSVLPGSSVPGRRGDSTKGQRLLDNWHVDFSACRTDVSEAEVMRIMLSIKSGKRPGTSGVCGEAYKRAAVKLAPVFQEAFRELKDDTFDLENVPVHICETLWSPAAKKQNANTLDAVRDLEIPNEDTKILERMHVLIVDECVSPSVREHNEAFVSDGDIMVNLFTMHEQFHRTFSKKELHMLLLLDCAKRFNLLSHKWLERVLRHAMLPNVLIL